jgi:hypothetical protein
MTDILNEFRGIAPLIIIGILLLIFFEIRDIGKTAERIRVLLRDHFLP